MRSKKGRASCGPGAASGWNWSVAKPSPLEALHGAVVQRDVADLGGVGGSTAKPWFWTVTSTRLDAAHAHRVVRAAVAEGELEGAAGRARARRSWCPRQIPEERHAVEQPADRLDLVDELGGIAGAVADEDGRGVELEHGVLVPVPGTTTASTPVCASLAMIERLQPRSRTTTRGPAPTAYGSSVHAASAGGGASRCGSARPRSSRGEAGPVRAPAARRAAPLRARSAWCRPPAGGGRGRACRHPRGRPPRAARATRPTRDGRGA